MGSLHYKVAVLVPDGPVTFDTHFFLKTKLDNFLPGPVLPPSG